ncbi:MAG: RDD family protein [Caldilineaceae bacterium]|jgi:uncharacterized RDD family membrane protein YckC
MNASPTATTANRSLEGEYAGFMTRAIAFILDLLIIELTVFAITGVVMMIIGFFASLYNTLPWASEGRFEPVTLWTAGLITTISLFIMIWLYPALFWMINGQTIGKRIMGLRVVRMDGSEMTFWRGLIRVFGYWVSAVALFLGFIWVLFSNQRRGWHDRLAGTCVIYSWDARGSAVMAARLESIRPKRTEKKQAANSDRGQAPAQRRP